MRKLYLLLAIWAITLPALAQNFTLQILHASDLEGGISAVGDAPRFAALIDTFEHTFPNSVTLSSGDNWIPGPFLASGEDPTLQGVLRTQLAGLYGTNGTTQLRAAIGRADIAMMNIMGFSASVFGNHEFDLGSSEVNSIIGPDIRSNGADNRWYGANFPYLSANLNFANDGNLSGLFTNQRRNAETGFLVPNGITNNNQKRGIAPSAFFVRGGQKIGLVGATTQVLAAISSPGATTVVGPSVNDMPALAGILQPVIDSLIIREGCNKIIVLAHLQQLALEQALAPLLRGVDVIIAGGSHTILADANDPLRPGDVAGGTYPIITRNADLDTCLIVNTGAEYRYLGRLVVTFDANGKVLPGLLNPAINGAYKTDSAGVIAAYGSYSAGFTTGSKGAKVKAIADAIGGVITLKDGTILGKTNLFMEGRRNFVRTEETNFGNLTAEANLWYARKVDPTVQVSLKNGGGIRSAIGEVLTVGSNAQLLSPAPNPSANKLRGDVSRLDIENSLRFNNSLSIVTTTAQGLKNLLEHGFANSTATATPGQFPQLAGCRVAWDMNNAAQNRIRSLVLTNDQGQVLDTVVRAGRVIGNPARSIRLVSLGFLVGGGDSYPFSANSTNRVNMDTIAGFIANPGTSSFANQGFEQDAFAEYMLQFHATAQTAYNTPESPVTQDQRIVQLARNGNQDFIFPFLRQISYVFPPNNARVITRANDPTPVTIRWTRGGPSADRYRWQAVPAFASFQNPTLNLASDNNGVDTTLSLTLGALDATLSGLGIAPGDSITLDWAIESFEDNNFDSLLSARRTIKLVRAPQFNTFDIQSPANNARVVTRPNDNNAVVIRWTSAGAGADRYRWLATTPGGSFSSPLFAIDSDNNGNDTTLTVTIGDLDGLAASGSVVQGDSVSLIWAAQALNNATGDRVLSTSNFNIKLVRLAEIGPFNLLSPASGSVFVGSLGDTNTKITARWTAARNAATYEFQLSLTQNGFPSALFSAPSNNNATDTAITFTSDQIAGLLQSYGIQVGDSIDVWWNVRAANTQDSRFATTARQLRVIRGANVVTANTPYDNEPLTVYPNPTSGVVYVANLKSAATLTLRNSLGQVVVEKAVPGPASCLDVSEYAPGTYYLTIRTESKSQTLPIVVR